MCDRSGSRVAAAVAGGRPAATGWCVQRDGGAVYMFDGTVTFQGGSSITGTEAVRSAQTHARERIHGHTLCATDASDTHTN